MTPAKNGGWTPVVDSLVASHGRTVATVWGVVWRYCQMGSEHVCTAAHATIAKRAGISAKSVARAIDILIKDGFIEKVSGQTPEKVTCTYRTTGKLRLKMSFEAEDDGEDALL